MLTTPFASTDFPVFRGRNAVAREEEGDHTVNTKGTLDDEGPSRCQIYVEQCVGGLRAPRKDLMSF